MTYRNVCYCWINFSTLFNVNAAAWGMDLIRTNFRKGKFPSILNSEGCALGARKYTCKNVLFRRCTLIGSLLWLGKIQKISDFIGISGFRVCLCLWIHQGSWLGISSTLKDLLKIILYIYLENFLFPLDDTIPYLVLPCIRISTHNLKFF